MNVIKKIRSFRISPFAKFILFILLVGLVYFLLLEVYNKYSFRVSFKIPLIISWLPFALMLVYMLVVLTFGKKWHQALAYCRYNRWCPFLIRYDPEPVKGNNIKIEEITDEIQKGDIVLRCYGYYLDELIFSRNSFFTHCGIYYGSYNNEESQVLHATGDKGVHAESITKFCDCKNVVVLRFSYDKIEEELMVHDIISNEPTKNSGRYDQEKDIRDREKAVFVDLLEKVKPGSDDKSATPEDSDVDGYLKIVLDRARTLIGKPYDFKFDFGKFDKFSCIEYVWFCFKFLFPLHRIRVKDFEFFKIIVPIMIPDVFIKNDYFIPVYISIPKVKTKLELKKYILPPRSQFERFFLALAIYGFAMLTAYHFFPVFMRSFFAPIFGSIIILHILFRSKFFTKAEVASSGSLSST